MRFFKAEQVRSVEDEVAAVRLMAVANRSRGRDPFQVEGDVPDDEPDSGGSGADSLQ
jgi:hypothetical protein